jgi:hypothetical protein
MEAFGYLSFLTKFSRQIQKGAGEGLDDDEACHDPPSELRL